MANLTMDWSSFLFGAVCGPLSIVLGIAVYVAIVYARAERAQRKLLAQSCAHCVQRRDQHSKENDACPVAAFHESNRWKARDSEGAG